MSNLATKAAEKMNAIPKWQFWRKWEREFWLGAILADYARTGSEAANKAANRLFDKHKDRFVRKYGKSLS